MSTRAGLELIKEAEGFKAKAYLCPAGIPTIGYGETRGVKLGMTITREEAEQRLIESYDEFEAKVLGLVKVSLTENQLGALVSFAYNLGSTNLANSTLLKQVNSKKFKEASACFAMWTKAKVKGVPTVLPGLVKRRTAERDLFIKP